MLKLKKVAITGGIASGKSTVCQFFRKLGAYVINADTIVRELLNPETALGQQIIHLLGPDILRQGEIDRNIVAGKVFQDPKKLRALEKLLHPEILRRIALKYNEACKTDAYTSFIVEMPLLFEIGAETNYDATVAVMADEITAQQRFQALGHIKQEYEQRMKRQMTPKQKLNKATYIIHNNGSFEDLEKQVKHLNAILSKLESHESRSS